MVQHGDFTIELVEATSKIPFKEHYRDAKVYVEVEPDIDYFISIKKTGVALPYPTKLYITVDGTSLDYSRFFLPQLLESEAFFSGLWSYQDGLHTMTALRFERPSKITTGSVTKSSTDGQHMGSVKIDIYEAVAPKMEQWPGGSRRKRSLSSSNDSSIGSKGKKVLRSAEGKVAVTDQVPKGTPTLTFQKGWLVDTIQLYYCAAAGLIEAGVLPKPNCIYEHHRILKKFTDPPKRHQGIPEKVPSTTVFLESLEGVRCADKKAPSDEMSLFSVQVVPGPIKPPPNIVSLLDSDDEASG